MSNVMQWLSRLLAARRPARPVAPAPEAMSLRDWADLPVYHPRSDRAPC